MAKHEEVTVRVDDESLNELQRSLAGTVIGPGDPEYDAARVCFNALVDRRPALIARCTGPEDVATSFAYARAQDLDVAVRGGGHNPAGHCVLESRAPKAARPGSTSTSPPRPSASSRREAWSARPASAGSRSAAGSGT
jgi:hypothetical protein